MSKRDRFPPLQDAEWSNEGRDHRYPSGGWAGPGIFAAVLFWAVIFSLIFWSGQ